MNQYQSQLIAPEGMKAAIVASQFNEIIVNKLIDGAENGLTRHGVEDDHIDLIKVPGAFEIPFTAKKLAQTDHYDAVICLGSVIRGETTHYDAVCSATTSGIADVSMETGIPVIFGVVMTENIEQALSRAGSKSGNKGYDHAVDAIEMVNILQKVDEIPGK